ncbi:MAG: DUF3883 domain-containing protein [Clostridiaceae bacterium]
MQLIWGKAKQLQFKDENEYYEALGIFSNPEFTRVYIEDNASRGSYSDAYRLQLHSEIRNSANLPNGIVMAMKDQGRINCNPYVNNLLIEHGFIISGNIICSALVDVLKTIPTKPTSYLASFIKGYYRTSYNLDSVNKSTYSTESIDVSSANLVKKNIPLRKKNATGSSSKKQGKRDYIKSAIDNFEIGEAGEKIVYEHEKKKLQQALKEGKMSELKNKIEWISRSDDSLGYDIKSYDVEKEEPIFIEVKTTVGVSNTPFFISENELKASEKLNNQYYLYRLYQMNRRKPEKVEFFILQGDISQNKNVEIESQNSRVIIVKTV